MGQRYEERSPGRCALHGPYLAFQICAEHKLWLPTPAAPFLHPSEGSVKVPSTVFEQQAEKRYLAPPPSSLVAASKIDPFRIHIHLRRDCIIDLRSRSN